MLRRIPHLKSSEYFAWPLARLRGDALDVLISIQTATTTFKVSTSFLYSAATFDRNMVDFVSNRQA